MAGNASGAQAFPPHCLAILYAPVWIVFFPYSSPNATVFMPRRYGASAGKVSRLAAALPVSL
jgi:hypothetical protein